MKCCSNLYLVRTSALFIFAPDSQGLLQELLRLLKISRLKTPPSWDLLFGCSRPTEEKHIDFPSGEKSENVWHRVSKARNPRGSWSSCWTLQQTCKIDLVAHPQSMLVSTSSVSMSQAYLRSALNSSKTFTVSACVKSTAESCNDGL